MLGGICLIHIDSHCLRVQAAGASARELWWPTYMKAVAIEARRPRQVSVSRNVQGQGHVHVQGKSTPHVAIGAARFLVATEENRILSTNVPDSPHGIMQIMSPQPIAVIQAGKGSIAVCCRSGCTAASCRRVHGKHVFGDT